LSDQRRTRQEHKQNVDSLFHDINHVLNLVHPDRSMGLEYFLHSASQWRSFQFLFFQKLVAVVASCSVYGSPSAKIFSGRLCADTINTALFCSASLICRYVLLISLTQ